MNILRERISEKGKNMFPTRMKQERIKRGWTQKKVADKVQLTVTSISDIENGKAKPSYKILCELEDLFDMPHKELLNSLIKSITN